MPERESATPRPPPHSTDIDVAPESSLDGQIAEELSRSDEPNLLEES